MNVYMRVRAEYFNAELSIHRLNMSVWTLIASLQQQTDRDFRIILETVENDPHVERRHHHFNQFGVVQRLEDLPNEPRVEIIVNDDVFLHRMVVQTMRQAAVRNPIPRTLVIPSGYLFRSGEIFEIDRTMDVVIGSVFRSEAGCDSMLDMEIVSRKPGWLVVEHANTDEPSRLRPHMQPLKSQFWWDGFSHEMITSFADKTAILATAEGYDVFPETRGLTFRKGGRTKGRR